MTQDYTSPEEQTMTLARQLLDKHGLVNWGFGIICLDDENDGDGEVAGICRHDERRIYIDFNYWEIASPWRIRKTILHEIAHALTPEDHEHGDAWQQKAYDIGCTLQHISTYWKDANSSWHPAGQSESEAG
jgi:hypothetical protein